MTIFSLLVIAVIIFLLYKYVFGKFGKRFFRWIFRLVKATLFGAVCGAGAYLAGTLVFGILQLFLSWTYEATNTLIWIGAIIAAGWAVVTIIRCGIEDDADDDVRESLEDTYEKVTGEKYTHVPPLESIGTQSSGASNKGTYQHESTMGVYGGKSIRDGDMVTHTDFWGMPQSYSEYKENGEIVHTDFWGMKTGHSVDKGDRVEHYDEWGTYQGYSEKRPDGSFVNYNEWGVEQGRSTKE